MPGIYGEGQPSHGDQLRGNSGLSPKNLEFPRKMPWLLHFDLLVLLDIGNTFDVFISSSGFSNTQGKLSCATNFDLPNDWYEDYEGNVLDGRER